MTATQNDASNYGEGFIFSHASGLACPGETMRFIISACAQVRFDVDALLNLRAVGRGPGRFRIEGNNYGGILS